MGNLGKIFHYQHKKMFLNYGQLFWSSRREKNPNTEFFLVRIFPHSDRIRRDTDYLPVVSPNAGKYGPEKIPHLDSFQAVATFC